MVRQGMTWLFWVFLAFADISWPGFDRLFTLSLSSEYWHFVVFC